MAHCTSQRPDAELSAGKTPVSKIARLATLDVLGGGESPCLLNNAISMITGMKSPIVSRAMILALLLSALRAVYADSSTWNLHPNSNDWNTAANWTPATVPNAPNYVATFSASTVTDPD